MKSHSDIIEIFPLGAEMILDIHQGNLTKYICFKGKVHIKK